MGKREQYTREKEKGDRKRGEEKPEDSEERARKRGKTRLLPSVSS